MIEQSNFNIAHNEAPAIMAVGRYLNAAGEKVLLPYSAPEFERATKAYALRLGTFHFRSGGQVLMTSIYDESYQFGSFNRALGAFQLVLLSSDASVFDAYRTESCLRRFQIPAVAGVSSAVLDGLEELGHSPAKLMKDKVVWSRPDSHQRLQNYGTFRVYRWLELGPAVALECSAGAGAHIDRLEWKVDEDNGELVLSSRLPRVVPFSGYRTGLSGSVSYTTCQCGSADPRIHLAGG